jgi:predicted DCC family thiol-disulfide oxidoreductase YuxK
MDSAPLTLFFDGLCPLCSREMAHYRRHTPAGAVHFLDITGPGFDASAHGLDVKRVHQVMHAKVGGEMRTGVDAFIALWQAIPRYRWLAKAARWPGVHGLLKIGYRLFARVRPLLPRRQAACTTGTCKR